MKQFIKAALLEKNSKMALIIALVLLGAAILGCSGGGNSTSTSKSKPVTSDYYGGWSGSDGTSLQIKSDGTGYYRSGGTTISGAAAELDESGTTLKLTFFGVSTKEFKIDQPPKNGTMKLDGMLYKNGFTSGGDTTSEDTDSSGNDNADVKMPSDFEIVEWTSGTITEFDAAVQREDFTDFIDQVGSRQFKEQFSNDKLKETFKAFIQKKEAVHKVLELTADLTPAFDPKPTITSEGSYKKLNLSGNFPTKPSPVVFKMTFIKEGDDWKILGFNVKIDKV